MTKETQGASRERSRELLAQGASGCLSEEALLTLALDYAAPRRDTAALARELLDRFGSLTGVLSASDEALSEAAKLSKTALTLLRLLSCLATAEDARPALNTVEDWANYLHPQFLHQRRERVFLLCLDGEAHLKECAFLGEGTDCAVNLDIAQICALARRCGARAAVLAHSHPSGMALPSHEDITTTRACRAALAEQGVRLLDHLIFTDDDCVSMAQSGLL